MNSFFKLEATRCPLISLLIFTPENSMAGRDRRDAEAIIVLEGPLLMHVRLGVVGRTTEDSLWL